MADLDADTMVVILLAGLMFLWGLVLGQVKYRQILASPAGHAHPYTDIAHRAALMYAFALMLIAVFVHLSAWPAVVDLAAAGVLAFYFVVSVGSYMVHGLRRDTTNQLVEPPGWLRIFMTSLVIAEIGGFMVLLGGFVVTAMG